MSPDVLSTLNAQYNHELGAAHAYKALACWCAFQNYGGFAEFFDKQSDEELEHAELFRDHLLDRGEMPVIGALPAPRTTFANLHEAVAHAGVMERANSAGINACYVAALKDSDFAAQVFLHGLISEQVEEEAWCSALLAKVEQATCAGALYSLDRHVIKDFAD